VPHWASAGFVLLFYSLLWDASHQPRSNRLKLWQILFISIQSPVNGIFPNWNLNSRQRVRLDDQSLIFYELASGVGQLRLDVPECLPCPPSCEMNDSRKIKTAGARNPKSPHFTATCRQVRYCQSHARAGPHSVFASGSTSPQHWLCSRQSPPAFSNFYPRQANLHQHSGNFTYVQPIVTKIRQSLVVSSQSSPAFGKFYLRPLILRALLLEEDHLDFERFTCFLGAYPRVLLVWPFSKDVCFVPDIVRYVSLDSSSGFSPTISCILPFLGFYSLMLLRKAG
jgi:hypothetical protein